MSKTPIIIGILALMVCCSSSSAAMMMMGDEETSNTTGPSSTGSSGGSDSTPVPSGSKSTKPAKLFLWGGPNCTGKLLVSRDFTASGLPLEQQWDMESYGHTVCCAEVENMKIHSATVGGDMFNVTDKEYSDNVKLDFGGCSDDVKFTHSVLE